MAGASVFDPAEFEAFKAADRALPDAFDPEEFARFKAEQPVEGGKPLAIKVRPKGETPSTWADTAWDVGASAVSGIPRGITGLLGFPNAALEAAEKYVTGPAARATIRAFGGTPASDLGLDGNTHLADNFISAETLNKGVNSALRAADLPELHTPQTVPGEFAGTIAEFAPNALAGGGSLLQRLAQVAVPAVTSETAGQVARKAAPDWEGTARFVGALGGGAGTAIAQMPRGGRATLKQAIDDLPAGSLDDALALGERSRNLPGGGLNLSVDELLNKVTSGRASRVSQIANVIGQSGGEGQKIASNFYAARPGQVDATGRALFNALAPMLDDPTALGMALQRSAQRGVAETSEGQALAAAREAAGPRVTPEQAGQAIQRDLRAVQDRREFARTEQAGRDYAAARAAPERIGIDRTVTVERPGEPVVTQPQFSRPQFESDAPAPLGPRPTASEGAEAGARSQSLLDYLARNGGIPLDAETRAADLNRVYRPGAGTLARRDAPTWDQIRVRLAENEFLPPGADGYVNAAGVRDLVLDALHQERIGRGRMVRMGEDAEAGMARRGDHADEYDAALGSARQRLDEELDRAGISAGSVHPDIRSRALNAMMSDPRLDALDAYERVVGSMREPPRPYSRSTMVQEEVSAPRFGQVNPQAALDVLDQHIATAKGDVRGALHGIRRDFLEYRPDPVSGARETDLSVQGLLHARERLDQHIARAQEVGDRTKMRDLSAVRTSLDRQLKGVPEVARADQRFAENSAPLEPFGANEPLGRVTARDELTRRMRTPAEQVPSHLSGATATREALREGTPATREALEGRLVTQILDGAQDARGNVSTERLRDLMRDQEDVLNQLPGARERLNQVAQARDGLAAVEASPLGRIADRPDVAKAVKALFPLAKKEGLQTGQQGEIATAMRALAKHDPDAANQLARIHLETVFDNAVGEKRGLPDPYGGAKFASGARGNPQVRKNLEATFLAMPHGHTRLRALDHLLTAFEATGYRPGKGSDTAPKLRLQEELGGGRSVGGAIASAATHGAAGGGVGGLAGAASGGALGIKKAAGDAWLRWQIGKNGGEIARLLFDPRALPELRALAQSRPGTETSKLFMARLFALGAAGSTSGDATADRVRQSRR